MDYRLLYPTLYLSAADLAGKDVTLTIRAVVVEELKTERGPEKKPVVYFVETRAKAEQSGDASKEKRLVMNKTNAATIASLYGNEVDDWKGKRITLHTERVSAFKKTQEAIRVRPSVPATATAKES